MDILKQYKIEQNYLDDFNLLNNKKHYFGKWINNINELNNL